MEIEDIKKFIVKKLFHHGYIGGRHTAVENCAKGLPGHIRGDAKEAIRELMHEEIIIQKPTNYGLHVFLNPRKLEEIEKYLN